VPHEEGILVEKLAWPPRLDVSLTKAGVVLFDKSDLLDRKLDLLLGCLLFQPKPSLVSTPGPLLVEDVLYGGALTEIPSNRS